MLWSLFRIKEPDGPHAEMSDAELLIRINETAKDPRDADEHKALCAELDARLWGETIE